MSLRPAFLLLALTAFGACNQDNPYSSKAEQKKPVTPPKIVGVDPTKFDCVTFLPVAEVSKIAGGEVTYEMGDFPPQEGIPRPCTYILPYKMTDEERKAEEKAQDDRIKRAEKNKGEGTYEDALAAWGVSKDKAYGVNFDCREGAHQRTLQWMEQVPRTIDPASVPPDSTPRQPGKDVNFAKKAVDYNGAFVFLDDKTPCAVTVTAPDETARMTLAQVVHGKLTMENAPMRPRSVAQ